MKCRYCKDKGTKTIDVTHDQNFGVDENDEVFFREEAIYDSQGTFRPRVDGDDEVFFREETPGDEKIAGIFVCEDHYRLWELLYGGEEIEEEGMKLEELKPEEREELEEATQKHSDEIEQIKERIRNKKQEKKERAREEILSMVKTPALSS